MIDLEISIGFLLALEQGDFVRMSKLLDDNMLFCGPVPRPYSKQAFLGLISAVRAGVPNWKSHFRDVQVAHSIVSMTIEMTGAHLQRLPGPFPGMPTHPPTGVYFHLPPERIEFAISGEKITRIHIEPVPGGSISGILEQLDIPIPAMN